MHVGCVAQSSDKWNDLALVQYVGSGFMTKVVSKAIEHRFFRSVQCVTGMTILLFEQQLELSEHGDVCLQSPPIF